MPSYSCILLTVEIILLTLNSKIVFRSQDATDPAEIPREHGRIEVQRNFHSYIGKAGPFLHKSPCE